MNVASPRPTDARRFTTLDAMILVGSLAAGLGVLRWFRPSEVWIRILAGGVLSLSWSWHWANNYLPHLFMLMMPFAFSMTLGFLALRLRRPRPRWRRLVRQPGLAACLALVLGCATAWPLTFLNQVVTWMRGYADRVDPLICFEAFCKISSTLGGFAVVIAWGTMLLVGRWRAEPSWIDRLGRIVGLGWIVMALAGAFVMRQWRP